jgi:hypothetical protein
MPTAKDNSHPRAWVDALVQQRRGEVVEVYGDTQLLAVRSDELDSDLARALGDAARGPGARLRPSQDVLGYATLVGSRADVDALRAAAERARAAELTAPQLAARLAKAPHFFVPLRKSAEGKPFADRISVGRALNNDVVLRHASVSKFHAYFQCDDKGAFYLTDARSKNTTTVNGALVESSMVPVRPGDEIAFGSVLATLCPAALLWDALSRP